MNIADVFWDLFLQAAYSSFWKHIKCTLSECWTIWLGLKIHFIIMYRDDPWLGAVQCSSGCGSRDGQTEHRGGPGNGGLDEEDGSVPSRAHRHWRVDWSPWLWGDILQFTKHKCAKRRIHARHTEHVFLIVVISISQDKAFMKPYLQNDCFIFFYHHTAVIVKAHMFPEHCVHVRKIHVKYTAAHG